MDLQHRMMRTAVGIIVNKAVHDMQKNTKRGIRSLVDLGEHFAKGENQRHFFNLAHEIIDNPRNPYNRLVLNMVKNIDAESIRVVGTNLGYSSFAYGVNTIRQQETVLGVHIPWMIVFDMRQDEKAWQKGKLDLLIGEGKEFGIYCYVFDARKAYEQMDMILALAQTHEECSFFITVCPELITAEFTEKIGQVHNVVVSIELTGIQNKQQECDNAFSLLLKNRCIYGFHTIYSSENLACFMSDAFIEYAIGKQCVFGAYINKEPENKQNEELVYHFANEIRGSNGKPLLAFDWHRDVQFISNSISKGSDFMTVSPKNKTVFYGKSVTGNIEQMDLVDMMLAVMPKI